MQDTNLQRQVIQKITIGVGAGLVLWLGLLMQVSGAIRDAAVGSSLDVAIGPLVLNHMSKQPVAGGSYAVNFSFESGLLWYFGAWIVVGAVVGYAVGKRGRVR